jgi:DNA-binding transcriptional ArsR family regulator
MSEAFPMRKITDPRVLRAMAHPVRLRLINDLVLYGPATATELAERVNESPANCSWHLRQLAKIGIIEEATDLPSKGRNRPWRWVPVGNRWGDPDDSDETKIAGRETSNAFLGFELAERNAWDERAHTEPEQWQQAAFANQSVAWLTAQELTELDEAVQQLFLKNMDRLSDPAARPEGSRPVRLIAWGVPAR